ncbi:MAG: hypothetical protein MJ127_05225, partial [Mogibacterium sp.]|nr:hypothetical protein [Mogibacterium sp.]
MVRLLVKKQLMEVFKGYLYNTKKNKARSRFSIVAWFLLFAFLMIVILGGLFTIMALNLCKGLSSADVSWLYFSIMSCLALVLGAFGSVFTTYAGLYLAKDNDLLLSMPIPVRDIITARLANVYIMGAMYSGVVMIPTIAVYWAVADNSFSAIICGIILALIVSVIVLVLSCLLGWVVAKISKKVKNKSAITVIASLAFISLHYYRYGKISAMIQDLLMDAAVYGVKIKESAHWIYTFGSIGEGNWVSTIIVIAIVAAALVITCRVIARGFLSMATSSGAVKKTVYVEKRAKERSAFRALVGKEFNRFTSSASYMLNCGLGILFIVIAAVAVLWKGGMVVEMLDLLAADFRPGMTGILFVTILMLLASMNDMSAPAVSLEGKSIWIPQSLPVEPKTVLRAKAMAHLLLGGIPMLLAILSVVIVLKASALESILIVLVSITFTLFSVAGNSFLGIKLANIHWTNEIVPIKQGGAVALSLFGVWIVALVFGGLFMWFAYKIGVVAYLAIWTAVFASGTWALMHWLD